MKPLTYLCSGLLAGTLVAASAADILSESFEFGDSVHGRSGVKAGDFFEGGPVQSGKGEVWSGQGMNFRTGSAEFIEGGGIRLIPGNVKGNFSFYTGIDPAKLGGGKKTLDASVEFVPGTLWGKDEQGGGITGLWVGLRSGEKKGLMISLEGTDHVVGRVSFEEKNARGRLWISAFAGGKYLTMHGEAFTMDVHMDHRLTLKVSPKGPKAECEFTELPSGETARVEMDLGAMPDMDKLQVDLTSIRADENESGPEIKKVTLKSE